MNKDYILYNLRGAQRELAQIITEIEKSSDYDYGEFVVNMSHLYHHINTAWNDQDASEQEVDECTEENFNRWRLFPDPETLLLLS